MLWDVGLQGWVPGESTGVGGVEGGGFARLDAEVLCECLKDWSESTFVAPKPLNP